MKENVPPISYALADVVLVLLWRQKEIKIGDDIFLHPVREVDSRNISWKFGFLNAGLWLFEPLLTLTLSCVNEYLRHRGLASEKVSFGFFDETLSIFRGL